MNASLRERAVILIRAEYGEVAMLAAMPLDVLNRGAPADLPFRSTEEVVNTWASRATAIATFAVNLGVITPDDALELVVGFFDRHPDLRGDPPESLRES